MHVVADRKVPGKTLLRPNLTMPMFVIPFEVEGQNITSSQLPIGSVRIIVQMAIDKIANC